MPIMIYDNDDYIYIYNGLLKSREWDELKEMFIL